MMPFHTMWIHKEWITIWLGHIILVHINLYTYYITFTCKIRKKHTLAVICWSNTIGLNHCGWNGSKNLWHGWHWQMFSLFISREINHKDALNHPQVYYKSQNYALLPSLGRSSSVHAIKTHPSTHHFLTIHCRFRVVSPSQSSTESTHAWNSWVSIH